jgi:diguanylate cyclase (GGDEF)-like protein
MPSPTFVDRLLGTDPRQRFRVLQTAIATALMGASAIAIGYLASIGLMPARHAVWWTLFTLGCFVGFLVVMRVGLNRRFAEPSLTVPQMVVALVSGAWAYAIAGPARGAVFAGPIVVLMFGMYTLSPLTVRRIGGFAVVLFGATMTVMATLDPVVYDPAIEVVHFFLLAVMLMAVAMLAAQLAALRQRLRAQKADLAKALSRIRDMATRDDVTGLANRRHAQEVLAFEHQRGTRSGQSFCIAIIDMDAFDAIREAHGHAVGDAVLRRFTAEARAAIRISDVLARWDDSQFMLLMTDTRGPLGRLGVDRLRERIAQMVLPLDGGALRMTLTAGVAEHRAGESTADTIARAGQALSAAQAKGHDRVVLM